MHGSAVRNDDHPPPRLVRTTVHKRASRLEAINNALEQIGADQAVLSGQEWIESQHKAQRLQPQPAR
jgi:hypothetical protein